MEQLTHAASRVTHRSLLLVRELFAILDTFEALGIPAVVLKGPALAVAVYGDLGLRQFRDLDVLVHNPDVARAKRALLTHGYRLPARVPPAPLPSQHHHRLVRSDGTIVELHWALAPPDFAFPLDADEVWSRLERVSLGGRTVLTLGVEDLALFLCAHGAKHLWERLSWVCDIAALLARRPDLDWDAVLTSARQRGAERMVLLALHLADDLLGAPVPEAAHERLRGDPAVRALGERVRIRMFAGPHPPTVWERRAFYWRVRERWRDRLRDLARAVFTPTEGDWQVVRFPNSLSSLYYLIRPLRLAAKYGARLLRSPAK